MVVCGPNLANIAKPLQYFRSQTLTEKINRNQNNVEMVTWLGKCSTSNGSHGICTEKERVSNGSNKLKLESHAKCTQLHNLLVLSIRKGYLFCNSILLAIKFRTFIIYKNLKKWINISLQIGIILHRLPI